MNMLCILQMEQAIFYVGSELFVLDGISDSNFEATTMALRNLRNGTTLPKILHGVMPYLSMEMKNMDPTWTGGSLGIRTMGNMGPSPAIDDFGFITGPE